MRERMSMGRAQLKMDMCRIRKVLLIWKFEIEGSFNLEFTTGNRVV